MDWSPVPLGSQFMVEDFTGLTCMLTQAWIFAPLMDDVEVVVSLMVEKLYKSYSAYQTLPLSLSQAEEKKIGKQISFPNVTQ